jgi:O-6-methylguanine DNA methyltransferase
MAMAVSEKGLAGLTLPRASAEATRALLQKEHPLGNWVDESPLPDLSHELMEYLEGRAADFSRVPLDLPATGPFRRRVWEICAAIPYGQTRTYAQLAIEAGSPRAFRAVGSAMASNPVPIVVPCHRVLGSSGSLVGFGGGIEQKRRLLDMEAGSLLFQS